MKQKTITIHGKEYPVAFDLQTLIHYEDVVGHSIFVEHPNTMKERIALVAAAVKSADENTELTFDKLISARDWETAKEVIVAHSIVDSMATDFFEIPKIEQEANKSSNDEQEEDGGKN